MMNKYLLGLYIHIPFCKSKCFYCNYYSFLNLKKTKIFISALDKEMSSYHSVPARFNTIYIGGGSPSALEPEQIMHLFELLYRHFSFSDYVETTFEVNPEDISENLLKVLKECHVNRISLGIQSLFDADLRFLGRRHTSGDIPSKMGTLREHGFKNINIDLIYGLPTQTIDHWSEGLEYILSFRPEHLSCYQLSIEKKTKLGTLYSKGKLQVLSTELLSAFFQKTSRILKNHGYVHYEVSNFAIDQRYFSRHNLKYWTRLPYIGLGPSAHSFIPENRWWNVQSLEKYISLLMSGRSVVQGEETLKQDEIKLERLFLGFRCINGHSLKFLHSFKKGEMAVKKLIKDNFITLSNFKVKPTEKGLMFSDYLTWQFF